MNVGYQGDAQWQVSAAGHRADPLGIPVGGHRATAEECWFLVLSCGVCIVR